MQLVQDRYFGVALVPLRPAWVLGLPLSLKLVYTKKHTHKNTALYRVSTIVSLDRVSLSAFNFFIVPA